MTIILLEGREGATAPSFPYEGLRFFSRTLDDIEHARIQAQNRVIALQLRELGVPAEAEDLLEVLRTTEQMTIEYLEGLWKTHPLAPWAKTIQGVGPKTIGRLVAEIGDPLTLPDGSPRTLSQLRAFAGHGDPKRKRKKGMSQEEAFAMGNPLVKKRLWLISKSGVIQMCPFCKVAKDGKVGFQPPPPDCSCAKTHVLRHVYNEARLKYAGAVYSEGIHVGEPLSDGHKQARAIRAVGKEFLRMLYERASR